MTKVIAIGQYSDTDSKALLQEFGALALGNTDELAALPLAQREGFEALAYKGHHPVNGAVMDLLPNIRIIANFGVGYDAIDVLAATDRGILVTNTPDVLNDDVADLAVALLISQSRQLWKAESWLRAGNWANGKDLPLARKMSGRRVGVLGMGRIGREIADRLAAFKCEIHYQSRSAKETPGWTYHADPVSLAEAVDDIVVAVVGGPDTVGYVSADVIGALGADGVIVNISRGSVIDEEALIAALENGTIRGAALDVFRNEPHVDPRFMAMPNAMLLPHIGSATVETRAEMGALQRRNLAAVLEGNAPLTAVNRV